MLFTEQKIEKQLQELKPTIHRASQPIPSFRYIEHHVPGAEAPDFDDSGWASFAVGQTWGGYDVTAWFRSVVPVPQEWKDLKLALRFLVGPRDGGESTAESLLYVEGSPLQAIDIWHESAWLPPELLKRNELRIAIKAWSGVLGVPDKRRFMVAELIVIDEAAEAYYHLADTVLKAVKQLAEGDLRRERLLSDLNESIKKLDWLEPRSEAFYASVKAALDELKRRQKEWEQWEELKPTVVGIGHSHIDMAWLWRLSHTREKASRTFATVLHLMRQYPEYIFLHTSPQLYKYLKQDYPEIYKRVKERIEAGQWEITGGMWVEPDTNIPNGESLIRQILYGKRFIREEFGLETNVVWLPDVFGYTWALPQIIRGCGIDRFMTTKISWSQYNRFPYDTFYWRGSDGTELFTHFITTPEEGSPFYTYNGMVEPSSVKGIWESYRQKAANDELLLAYGWGDGGGGPTQEMLEAGRAMRNIPGLPRYETGKVEPYFDRLVERVNDKSLPVWDGELYLEYHRGTYTSQGWIKRANRKMEWLLHNVEWLSALAGVMAKHAYPRDELDQLWELFLLNQFHDILPGSSIRQVYEDAREQFRSMTESGERLLQEAIQTMARSIKLEGRSVVVFNGLSFDRGGLLSLSVDALGEGKTLKRADGQPATIQKVLELGEEKLLVDIDDVPSLGYRAFPIVDGSELSQTEEMTVSPRVIENRFFGIVLNENGQLTSVLDKRHNREVLAPGQTANVLQAFEDRPMKFDAWDIDLFYQEKMTEIDALREAVVEESGPLRGVLRLVWTFAGSVITQRLTVYHSIPRIDFVTEVDWQERQVLLKTAFPVQIRTTKAVYDIPFGSIERPTHWNTSWDYARFEVPAHKWADLSEGNYGVSLFNDCKYGYDIKDNVMRLTLIKSPVRPDETADRGQHVFTYSLYPHDGDWRSGGTVQAAYDLNASLFTVAPVAPGEGSAAPIYRMVQPTADHVIVETVKRSEDGKQLIVRVYEYKQHRSDSVELRFGQPVRRAAVCNMVEEGEELVELDNGQLRFPIRPFEVKTFKIWL